MDKWLLSISELFVWEKAGQKQKTACFKEGSL